MTIKVMYINDSTGVRAETYVYQVSEYATTATPNSPLITGPTGTIDPSFIPASVNDKATKLVVDRTAQLVVSEGELVRAIGTSKVQPADANTTASDATVLGLALNDALVGENVSVLVLGIVSDPSYSVFPINSQLFLDLDGAITDDRPTQPSRKFLTEVGKSLGNGEILISIEPPVVLGV